jgi:hypothetical protein
VSDVFHLISDRPSTSKGFAHPLTHFHTDGRSKPDHGKPKSGDAADYNHITYESLLHPGYPTEAGAGHSFEGRTGEREADGAAVAAAYLADGSQPESRRGHGFVVESEPSKFSRQQQGSILQNSLSAENFHPRIWDQFPSRK